MTQGMGVHPQHVGPARTASWRGILALVMLLALVCPLAVAQADPVQEFSVQLKDLKPDGQYTIVFTANSYDTSGDPPPLLESNSVRFAAGLSIKKAFLGRDYQCDVAKLREALQSTDEADDDYFFKLLDNLPATYRRVKDDLTPKLRKVVQTCIRAQIGTGRVVVDARLLGIDDALPSKIYVYMSGPRTKGAIASFGVFAVLDESSPAVQRLEALGAISRTFRADLFSDPSADGRFGYKLVLPTGAGLRISIAELKVTAPGITKTAIRKTCLVKREARCVKSKTTTTKSFWLNAPTCPTSGQATFRSDYGYETGLQTQQTIQVPCPRFKR
jgi:hypothetical protein